MINKTDIQLKQDIDEELSWDPKVNAAQIGVSVERGAVTLTGSVDTYAEKFAAADAIKRVGGVRALAEELTVKVLGHHQHTDSEIATAAGAALKWDAWIPEAVMAKVENGKITLEGQVAWSYQRDSAERVVRYLAGVVSVTNAITIKPIAATSAQVQDKVQAALQRQATADASTIRVGMSDGTVTLSGSASCWHALADASDAAWSAAGVTRVVNNVTISGF